MFFLNTMCFIIIPNPLKLVMKLLAGLENNNNNNNNNLIFQLAVGKSSSQILLALGKTQFAILMI